MKGREICGRGLGFSADPARGGACENSQAFRKWFWFSWTTEEGNSKAVQQGRIPLAALLHLLEIERGFDGDNSGKGTLGGGSSHDDMRGSGMRGLRSAGGRLRQSGKLA